MDADVYTGTSPMRPERRRRMRSGRIVAGLVVVAVGVLFLLDNLGVADGHRYLRYWPVALILLGLVKLLEARRARKRVGAALLVIIGSLLLAQTFGMVTFDVWRLWPVWIIVAGFGLVAGALEEKRYGR